MMAGQCASSSSKTTPCSADASSGLRQQGHAVDWVRDGAAAERRAAGEPYEVVLLDLGPAAQGRPGGAA